MIYICKDNLQKPIANIIKKKMNAREMRSLNREIVKKKFDELSVHDDYKAASKMNRLYMMCLATGINHVTLTKMLKELNIEL